jgi:hypothetical protein
LKNIESPDILPEYYHYNVILRCLIIPIPFCNNRLLKFIKINKYLTVTCTTKIRRI